MSTHDEAQRAPSSDSGSRSSSKRHLRNYLLDREYQLRHVLILVCLVALVSIVMGALLLHYIRLASRVVEVRALDPTDMLAQSLHAELQRSDLTVLLLLAGFDVVLLLVLFSFGIVFTHKVAGPLYKISTYMHWIRDGRLGQVADLRKGDQLRSFFESFREMHAVLRRRAEEEAGKIDEARKLLAEGKGEEARALLDALYSEKRSLLS